jgi:hypothetical protein
MEALPSSPRRHHVLPYTYRTTKARFAKTSPDPRIDLVVLVLVVVHMVIKPRS